MTVSTALVVALWVVVAMMALALSGLLAQIRVLHARIDSVARSGVPAQPPSAAPVLTGSNGPISGPYVALFVSPDCSACNLMLKELERVLRRNPPSITTVLVGDSRKMLHRRELTEHVVLVDSDEDATSKSFGVPAVPWMVTVDSDGRVVGFESAFPPNKVERALAQRVS